MQPIYPSLTNFRMALSKNQLPSPWRYGSDMHPILSSFGPADIRASYWFARTLLDSSPIPETT